MSGGASVEDTLALWASALRDGKRRIRPLFTQDRVATSAGQFLDALLGNQPRRTGWMRAEAAGDDGLWLEQGMRSNRPFGEFLRSRRTRLSPGGTGRSVAAEAPHPRSQARRGGTAGGHQRRMVCEAGTGPCRETRAGTVELRIPKLRRGSVSL